MAVTIPENEPFELCAGERWQWKRALADYPASESWVLTYYLVHQTNTRITITASADGDDHSVDVAASITEAYVSGDYHWQAYVSKATEKYKVDSGVLKIKPYFGATGVTTLDARSHAEKTLALIESAIEGSADKDVQSYTINGRSLSRYGREELVKLRNQYRWYVRQEQQAERIKNGLDSGASVRVRFT